MKITGINAFIVYAKLIHWIFVKVETDEGLVGWGEGTLEWKPKGVVGCVEDLSQFLIGEDPRRTEYLWQVMYRQYFIKPGVVALAAISGIDQACWDIHAKSLGVPLYQLLGGACRDKIPMYTHLGGGNLEAVFKPVSAEEYVEEAQKALDDGFKAVKVLMTPSMRGLEGLPKIKYTAEIMEGLRTGLGDDIDIMVEFHGRCTPDTAIQCGKALEPYHPYWFEEPCSPDNISGLLKVARAVNIPIASGERIVLRHNYRPILEQNVLAVIQPDVCHTGGITELRKIASMADAYSVPVAPHNPMGPIATAVNCHVALSTPNFLTLEVFHSDVPWRNEVVHNPMAFKDGYMTVTDEPGIGIEVDEEEIKKHPYEGGNALRFFHEDGSVADW